MVRWLDYKGKKVFIISKNSKHPFTGEVIDVDIQQEPELIWITIIDKYGQEVTIVHSEIEVIKVDEVQNDN